MEERKVNKVKPIIEELLQAIEGNGMTIRAWFEVLDQIAISNMVTQNELSQGMRMLQIHSADRKKQPILTTEKVGGCMWRTSFSQLNRKRVRVCPPFSDEITHLLSSMFLVSC